MEIAKQRISYKGEKRESKMFKWLSGNQIFSIIVVFTMFFSILNIAFIVNFFKLLSNF